MVESEEKRASRAKAWVNVDSLEWSIVCAKMSTLINHGHIAKAHQALDEFIASITTRTRLEFSSPLSLLVSPELANMLECGGYLTIGSVVNESDRRLLEVPMLGPVRLAELRKALALHGFRKAPNALEIFQAKLKEKANAKKANPQKS